MDDNKITMQIRCVHCGKEQYGPAVYGISMDGEPCVWCGEESEQMDYETYRKKLNDLNDSTKKQN